MWPMKFWENMQSSVTDLVDVWLGNIISPILGSNWVVDFVESKYIYDI